MKDKALKTQAWVLLTVTSITFGRWMHSTDAALFFGFSVLLVGTVITGFMETYRGKTR